MATAKRIIVIGGGIKGSSLAALLSACEEYEVLLIDRGNIGSGTTCTNHGRLHLGTANWRREPLSRMRRRLSGRRLGGCSQTRSRVRSRPCTASTMSTRANSFTRSVRPPESASDQRPMPQLRACAAGSIPPASRASSRCQSSRSTRRASRRAGAFRRTERCGGTLRLVRQRRDAQQAVRRRCSRVGAC